MRKSGHSLSLTNGIDTFTGGTGNDVFSGTLNAQGAVTFQAFDQLNGGAGKDTLIIQSIGTTTTNASTIQNIERVEVYGLTGGSTLGLANNTGIEEILNANAAGNATYTGINAGIKSLEVTGNPTAGADTTTFTVANAASAGADDSVMLKLSGVGVLGTNDNVVIQPTSGVNGFETINVESVTSPNFVTLDDGTATSLKTLNVKGDANLTLTVTPATLTKFDATQATGAVSVNLTTNTQIIDVKGGSADDTFNFGNGLTRDDKVDGAAGNNTLQFNSAATTLTDTFQVSNVQTLRISDALAGNLDVSKFGTGINGIRLDADSGANTRTISKLGADATLDLRVAQTAGAQHTLALTSTSGTDDKVSIALNGNYSAGGATALNYRTVKVDNIETVTIRSNYDTNGNPDNQGDQAALTLDAAQAKKLVVTGKVGLTLAGSTITSVTDIDSTGLVAEVPPANNTAGDGGLNVTLATGANQTATVKAGNGNNVIVSAAGSDNITTGSGVDRVTIGTGNDTVDLGAGDDFLVLGAAGDLTANDTIKGGDGVDRLDIQATMTLADSAFTNVTGFERIIDTLGVSNPVNLNLGANAAAAFGNTIRIDQTNAGTGATYNVNGAGLSSGQIVDFRGAAQALVDTVVGGAGNDVIRGGGAADLLTGGAGSDTFRIGAVAESVGTVAANTTRTFDKITDYVAGVDSIKLLSDIFAGLTLTANTTYNVATIADNTATTYQAVAALGGVAGVAASTAATVNVTVLTLSNAAFLQNGAASTILWINDGNAGLQATDVLIDITGVVGTISGSDFGLFTV